MKVKVDNKTYPSRKAALKDLHEAMKFCEGSEGDRMSFAYCAVMEGFSDINTYTERIGHL